MTIFTLRWTISLKHIRFVSHSGCYSTVKHMFRLWFGLRDPSVVVIFHVCLHVQYVSVLLWIFLGWGPRVWDHTLSSGWLEWRGFLCPLFSATQCPHAHIHPQILFSLTGERRVSRKSLTERLRSSQWLTSARADQQKQHWGTLWLQLGVLSKLFDTTFVFSKQRKRNNSVVLTFLI